MNVMRLAVGELYLKASESLPASIWMITPPMPPAMVPMPMTEATVFFGNMSETVVKRFADHAWCAAAPMQITATASTEAIFPKCSTLPKYWVVNTVNGNTAMINMAVM